MAGTMEKLDDELGYTLLKKKNISRLFLRSHDVFATLPARIRFVVMMSRLMMSCIPRGQGQADGTLFNLSDPLFLCRRGSAGMQD